jgi:hypothetical protein
VGARSARRRAVAGTGADVFASSGAAIVAASSPEGSVEVSQIIMRVIAGTIALCTIAVIAFKGVDYMPFKWIGVVGAAIFFSISLAMTRLH